ncbi:MAG: AAA family ATPase [Gemmatimonadetes bacterium]|nr:AAA family ATPase [Gemmatimonadota bacterium]
MNEATTFRVQLFGGPKLFGPLGEQALSPFQLALVTLVYAGGSMSRPTIARLLWRMDANPKTRQRIRQLRHGIGRRVGESILDSKGDVLAAAGAISCDMNAFHVALGQGKLLEAAKYLSQGFASSVRIDVGGEFDDWLQSFEADLLRRISLSAGPMWESSVTAGNWVVARDAAEAMYLLAGKGDEAATGRVIEARARLGKLHAAEAAYAEYRDANGPRQPASELIEELIARVRSIQSDSAPPEVPFVGRRDILAELTPVLQRVHAGSFPFVLVTGEAGIGKTRLLGELRKTAHLDGIRCLWAQPVELEQRISLNPILDALRAIDLEAHLAALGEPWRTVIGYMLPPGQLIEPVGQLPPIDESSLPRRLLDAFSLLFQSVAEEQPTVLFVDDLHWADATTIAALQFFRRRWGNARFGVIATVRPELVQRRDPLAQYLADDTKSDLRRLSLGELSKDEARQLIDLVGDHRIGEIAAAKLTTLAGLHPLYLTELAKDYLADRLRLPEQPAEAIDLPISLQQILTARTDGLSQSTMKVARLLAVATKAMRLNDVAILSEQSIDEAAEAVEQLVDTRLAEVDRDRTWIAHDLFRSAIYKQMSEARRALIHRNLADHIQAEGSDESSGELSIHFDRAGEPALSAQYGWIAADRALERGAVAEAAHFYEFVTRNEADEPRRAEATARLATAFHLNRDISRANPALELASSRLRAVGNFARARRMDIRRVEGLAEARDTPVDKLVERLAAIKQEAREGEDWEAVALALDVELQLLQLDDNIDHVRDLYPEFLEIIATGTEDAAAIAHRGFALGILQDDPAQALRSATEAVRLTISATPDQRLKTLNRLLIVLFHRGLIHHAENQSVVVEAGRLALRSGDLLQRFSFESNMGAAFLDAGDLDRAEVLLAKAGKLLGAADMTFPRINLACNLGELALARGDFGAAAVAFEEAGSHLGPTIPKYTGDFVNAGLGLCALEAGALTEARRREESLGPPPALWHYDPTVILAFRARLLERRGARDEAVHLLTEALEDLEGRLVMAWIKVRALQVRLMIRARLPGCRALAEEAHAIARNLGLHHRAEEFAHLRQRAPRS